MKLWGTFILSSVVLWLAIPPTSWGILTVFWLISLWAIEKQAKKSFLYCYCCQQALLFSRLFFWLLKINLPAFLLIGFLYLLFSAIFAFSLKHFKLKFLIIFLQLVLLNSLPIFPSILLPGYWLYQYPLLIGSVRIWGIVGLSLMLWLLAWLTFQKKFWQAILVIIILISPFYFQKSTPPAINLSLIQAKATASLSDYYRLSQRASSQSALIIWPETAIPATLRNNWQVSEQLRDFVEGKQKSLLSGCKDEQIFSGVYQPLYNSALLLATDGSVKGIHYKSKLLPLTELGRYRLPLPYFLKTNFLGDFFCPKKSQQPIYFQNKKLGIFICYEAHFAKLIKEIAINSDLLINLSSDGWNKSQTAHLLNLIPNIFRAVENNRWLFRVSDSGYSVIISNKGQIVKSLKPFNEGVLDY